MTVPGDSGSPVFHENKVVGIMVSIRFFRNHPVFGISYVVPLERFQKWNTDNNNDLSFAWGSSKKLPNLPFYYLKFADYKMN